MSEAYKVLSSTTDCVIVSVNEKTSYSLSPQAFSLCEMAIAGGGDIDEVFMSMSTVTAKSAKVFDPAKAAAAALKVKVNAAIVDFQTSLSEHVWSDNVLDVVANYQDAQEIVGIASQAPMPKLDLNVLRRIEGRLAVNDAAVWSYVKRGKDEGTFFVYEVKTSAPPDHAANVALQESKATFQLAAHQETLSLASPVLASELKVTSFALDDSGNIIYDANVPTSTGGNGGGKKRRVKHLASGTIYDSMTDAGNIYFPDVKYPHVKVREAAKKGKTWEFVD